ncbi:RDD family protein [Pelagibacterium sp. 26DY04]|uniref:RDD family protein n=1 Tax=Pelagibacterium sp. 26DY04 TaxID=2967130 RepID=UPI00281518F6|nr:RDD family protein [Pelagibacterium sp. 26DY04]WMT88535.1 RDD family protein [Pelagibacterium sp. 26DY04]
MATDFLGRIVRDDLPNPANSPELFEGILTRRVFAFLIDCVIMGILVTLVTLVAGVLGIFTFGLAWLSIPIIIPVTFIAYYAATLGSSSRATLGMRAMDIVLTPTREVRLDGWMAMIHVVLFWISTTILTPFIVLIGLFTNRRQLLHDMVAGTLMVRRSPMVRHWRAYAHSGEPA